MSKRYRFVLIVLGLGLLPTHASADFDDGPRTLTGEWWQWALSIPASVHPQLDTTGADCMVGQHGDVWFLGGVFGGGSVTRSCAIPEDVELFFPIINSVNVNTPNICGQGPNDLTVPELRALVAPLIDNATNLSVRLDGRPVRDVRRIRSHPFAVALPVDNVFVAPCNGDSPAGVYSPGIDDGIYATIHRLPPGVHHLHFHAESGTFVEDVRYELTVVAVR